MDINKINDPSKTDSVDEISDGSSDDECNSQSGCILIGPKFTVKKSHNSDSKNRKEDKECFKIKPLKLRKNSKSPTRVFYMDDMKKVWNYLDRLIKGDIMFYPRFGYLIQEYYCKRNGK